MLAGWRTIIYLLLFGNQQPTSTYSTGGRRNGNKSLIHIRRVLAGLVYAVGKLVIDSYGLIFAEQEQYEYRFRPQPLTPYYGEGGTGMSNCCDSPMHIFDEHHPLAVSYMEEGDVEELKYTSPRL
eukprot:6205447-Pleurochrysis_carterae.AAC.3